MNLSDSNEALTRIIEREMNEVVFGETNAEAAQRLAAAIQSAFDFEEPA